MELKEVLYKDIIDYFDDENAKVHVPISNSDLE
jgi:hypothetical protein